MAHHAGRSTTTSMLPVFCALFAFVCSEGVKRGTPDREPEIIRQTQRNTCGPAALAMLLTSLGRPATEAELSDAMTLGPDGVTLSSILETASTRGVRLEAWRLRADTLGSIAPPAILWIDGDHFVVFDSLAANGAHLRDPSSGRVVVPLERLRMRWDGTAALVAGPS